jgi:hypothetical protein
MISSIRRVSAGQTINQVAAEKRLHKILDKPGAWGVATQPKLQQALSNAVLHRHGFLFPSTLAAR